MTGKNLHEMDEEKDLGVIMQSDLKWNRQCKNAVKTPNRIFGIIRRSLSYVSKRYNIAVIQNLGRTISGILRGS
jgi:hypothetical protein